MIDERRIRLCANFAHDIIRLPSEARVDHDHEALLHDIMMSDYFKTKEGFTPEWRIQQCTNLQMTA